RRFAPLAAPRPGPPRSGAAGLHVLRQESKAGQEADRGPQRLHLRPLRRPGKGVIGSDEIVSTGFAELAAGPADQPRVQCSFRGKCRDQVAGLIVSSAQTGRNTPATICTECLDLCTEIITEELGELPT